MTQLSKNEERKLLGDMIIGTMRAPRSEFERGYLAALTDLWKRKFTDTPPLIVRACDWYKPILKKGEQ